MTECDKFYKRILGHTTEYIILDRDSLLFALKGSVWGKTSVSITYVFYEVLIRNGLLSYVRARDGEKVFSPVLSPPIALAFPARSGSFQRKLQQCCFQL